MLCDFQFGFRANHSTSLTLMEVVDNIFNNLENKEYVVGTCLDLQKAFYAGNRIMVIAQLFQKFPQ